MIAIDIGNTTITLGKFSRLKLNKVISLSCQKINQKKINKVFEGFKKEKKILACSVFPAMNQLLDKTKRQICWINKEKIPIKCNYNKKNVGIDRLIAAYAAKKLEPGTRMVIDFGTAITLDFISKEGVYQGGMILPGINSTLLTLERCALLPNKIKLRKNKKIIPENTGQSINRGLELGFSHMLNGIIKEYRKGLKLKPREKVIITGGDFHSFPLKLNFSYIYKPYLVLRGLNLISQKYYPT